MSRRSQIPGGGSKVKKQPEEVTNDEVGGGEGKKKAENGAEM